ncbi:sensor histidine kinase [Arachidicoccus soli]|uniref:histidine kinase n=1 Tax=Arachidicoccus soli TaxID=2341117 RepID=A0A386HNM0_9BACT|nr:HAMP domain-containing sensor histidine kinase [Arachidicoccus soli]AYD47061.1 sensor histidine kinase [Arachidicoccus soli]
MKLLNYTSIRYLLFAALLLFISIPAFYFVLNRIFIHSIDNDLYQQAIEIPIHQPVIKTERDLNLWRILDNDLEIVKADSIKFHKKPFTQKSKPIGEDEPEDFRILQKRINILGQDYIVQIKSSMIEQEDLIQTILIFQLSLFCLLLLGAVVINYFINKKVWQPFYKNLEFLKNFKLESTISEPGENGKIQEFQQLNYSVHQLAVSVRNAYLSQKEFTENASHELQTPLSVLKFKLELLLQDNELTAEQSLLIDDMYQVIAQMERLNKNLLLLSKIENHQFAFDESFEVNAAILEIKNELLFMAEAKFQEIKINSGIATIYLNGNKQLFKTMIKNLLRNAIQHSKKDAIIHIEIHKNKIVFENPGKPLSLTKDKLFTRFSKSENVKGNGLGLAIAKSIATLHNLQLHYSYKNNNHLFQIDI